MQSLRLTAHSKGKNCQTVQMLSSTFMGILLPASFFATDRMKIYSPCRQTYLTHSLGQEGIVRALSVFHPPRSLVGSVEEFSCTRPAPLLTGGIAKKARSEGQPLRTLGGAFTLRLFHWALFVLHHGSVAVMSASSLIPP